MQVFPSFPFWHLGKNLLWWEHVRLKYTATDSLLKAQFFKKNTWTDLDRKGMDALLKKQRTKLISSILSKNIYSHQKAFCPIHLDKRTNLYHWLGKKSEPLSIKRRNYLENEKFSIKKGGLRKARVAFNFPILILAQATDNMHKMYYNYSGKPTSHRHIRIPSYLTKVITSLVIGLRSWARIRSKTFIRPSNMQEIISTNSIKISANSKTWFKRSLSFHISSPKT